MSLGVLSIVLYFSISQVDEVSLNLYSNKCQLINYYSGEWIKNKDPFSHIVRMQQKYYNRTVTMSCMALTMTSSTLTQTHRISVAVIDQ